MTDGEGRHPGRGSGTSGSDRGIAPEVNTGPNTDQRTRRRLPNRRPSKTISFWHGGANFTMTAGRYDEGQKIGEIFINAAHANSALDALASDAAIAISFALQFGADLAAIKAAMKRNSAGEPSSPIGAALDRIAP